MKPSPLHIKCECCFALFHPALIQHGGIFVTCATFSLKMYAWAPQKWHYTFRLQRSAALAQSAAMPLAMIGLGLLQKAYFLSRFAVVVYVWSLCIFGFVSLPASFWTRACLCICVLLNPGWFIPSFSGGAVWGPSSVMSMRSGLYVIEESLWKPPPYGAEQLQTSVCPYINSFSLPRVVTRG